MLMKELVEKTIWTN